ncbi:uncharacterized protein LOC129591830 [Paramacrobiotus metropolitanus]|uniref:uncharacterized protein LOC129591830 n=1 Tax=Paramacrobiotus metropolitanus TaxID=2943436 RepID=UPI00244628E9|nr:uncharacterized protein LOC129591830 [Paramacrobiotus metropolitanus]
MASSTQTDRQRSQRTATPADIPRFLRLISALIVAALYVPFAHAHGKQVVKRQAGVPAPAQNPPVLQALDQLRGNEALSATQVQQVLAGAYPGQYPTYSYIPQTSFSCTQVRQFGYYADPETRCQVFRRCEANNFMFSYICPNGTVFNQITLVCDWFFNVNCPVANGFFDYSNPRIYRQDLHLFDDYYPGAGAYGGAAGYSPYPSASGASGAVYAPAAPSYAAAAAPAYSSGLYSATGASGGLYGGSYGMSGSAPIPAIAPAALATAPAGGVLAQATPNTAAQAGATQYRNRMANVNSPAAPATDGDAVII